MGEVKTSAELSPFIAVCGVAAAMGALALAAWGGNHGWW